MVIIHIGLDEISKFVQEMTPIEMAHDKYSGDCFLAIQIMYSTIKIKIKPPITPPLTNCSKGSLYAEYTHRALSKALS